MGDARNDKVSKAIKSIISRDKKISRETKLCLTVECRREIFISNDVEILRMSLLSSKTFLNGITWLCGKDSRAHQ